MRQLMSMALSVMMCACAPPDEGDDNDDVPGPFGDETVIVVLVNPEINQGSTTDVLPGPNRAGITVTIDGVQPPISATTSDAGIAILTGAPTGTNTLRFEDGTIDVEVVAEGELYDVVVAVRDGVVEEILPTVRYPVGGEVAFVSDGASIAAAAQEDNAIVVVEPGQYPGGEEIRASNVLIFGILSPAADVAAFIDGDVSWLGGEGRLRGMGVTGTLSTNANGFSAAFCEIENANITGNGVSLIRNRFGGNATVPSSNAILVDNEGIP